MVDGASVVDLQSPTGGAEPLNHHFAGGGTESWIVLQSPTNREESVNHPFYQEAWLLYRPCSPLPTGMGRSIAIVLVLHTGRERLAAPYQ